MRATMQRKRFGLAFALALGLGSTLLPTNAEAAPTPGGQIRGRGGNVGLGLSVGDPLGMSFKWFMAPKHALQSDLGWAPLHHGHGRFGADYLFHPGTFVNNSTLDLVPYFGFGLGIMFWGSYYHGRYHDQYRRYRGGGAAMFIRAPILGLGIHWKKVPIDTVTEFSWAPYIIYPDLPHGDFSFKARYYF